MPDDENGVQPPHYQEPNQQMNQNMNLSPEQVLMNLLLNSGEDKIARIRLVDEENNNLMSEVKSKLIVNADGSLTQVEEETINVRTLADGTSLNSYGIVKCLNCGEIVSAENIGKCYCGKNLCVVCGKISRRGIGYCSKWHMFWGSFGF